MWSVGVWCLQSASVGSEERVWLAGEGVYALLRESVIVICIVLSFVVEGLLFIVDEMWFIHCQLILSGGDTHSKSIKKD